MGDRYKILLNDVQLSTIFEKIIVVIRGAYGYYEIV